MSGSRQLVGIALLCGFSLSQASAQEPLHEAIDRLIVAGDSQYAAKAAPLADDDEFVRRIHLDLVGALPSVEVARAFRANDDPEKRAKLVDRLLASPEHARHLQQVVDVWLMRRLPAKQVTAAEWQTFLRDSFARNDGWDDIVRAILAADGGDLKNRGPARFFLDRNGDTNTITRDVSELFLGADIQCAQCHDHPEVDDYKQAHYYGLSAFFVRSYLFTDPKLKKSVFAEKGVGEVTFKSVFDKAAKDASTPPRLFEGKPIEEPKLEKGKEYKVKPAKNVRPVPLFSRRDKLPSLLASKENPRFARNAVNRFWETMLGRGLVHPVDADHSDNPPSHPELLDRLGQDFADHDFDVRWLLREIALSDTYQRSSRLPESVTEPLPEEKFAQAILKPLTAEQFAKALVVATGEIDVLRPSVAAVVDAAAKKAKETLDEKTRATRLEAEMAKRIAGYEGRFVGLFGGRPGEPPAEFEARVDQTLFLMNDALILGTLRPKGRNLAQRLGAMPPDDPEAIAVELFESILIRPPAAADVEDVRSYLEGVPAEQRPTALGELVWALVTSAEFRFNH